MTTTLHFTPALYRVLSAIDQGELSVSRNGALEPFVYFKAMAALEAYCPQHKGLFVIPVPAVEKP